METRLLINDFAKRCFRDVADHDYIAARMCYRSGLYSQFYWSALQAIEKYLKAILLFHRVRAKDIKHNLERAWVHAKKLPFEIHISDSTREMIERLDRFGQYRYLEASFYVDGPVLPQLDKTVWEIRRYCKVLDYTMDVGGKRKHMLQNELKCIRDSEKRPYQLTLPRFLYH